MVKNGDQYHGIENKSKVTITWSIIPFSKWLMTMVIYLFLFPNAVGPCISRRGQNHRVTKGCSKITRTGRQETQTFAKCLIWRLNGIVMFFPTKKNGFKVWKRGLHKDCSEFWSCCCPFFGGGGIPIASMGQANFTYMDGWFLMVYKWKYINQSHGSYGICFVCFVGLLRPFIF